MEKTLKETLDEMLFSMLGDEELMDIWWHSPNKAFENKVPNFVYEIDPQKVLSYVTFHYNR